MKHPLVKECCVVGQKDKNHSQGMLPVGYVVLDHKTYDPDSVLDDLKLKCEEELPEYAQPQLFYVLDAMPLTSIGKINYRDLKIRANEI